MRAGRRTYGAATAVRPSEVRTCREARDRAAATQSYDERVVRDEAAERREHSDAAEHGNERQQAGQAQEKRSKTPSGPTFPFIRPTIFSSSRCARP